MLTFYPEFDCESQDNYEIIILLDMSNSMSSEDIISVKKIAIVLLNSMRSNSSFNLITYGSSEYTILRLSVHTKVLAILGVFMVFCICDLMGFL